MKMKKSGLVILFIVVLSLLLPFIPIAYCAGWYSENWGYRKSHTIYGSTNSSQTDYQVCIVVYYGSGTDGNHTMQAVPSGKVYLDENCTTDFSDIRFTASDGVTPLDYWIQTYTASTSATFWVEVDSIPIAPGTTEIYIYYNNSDATSISSADNTFLAWNDMDDISEWSLNYTTGSPQYTNVIYDGETTMKVDLGSHNDRIRLIEKKYVPYILGTRTILRAYHAYWNGDSYFRFLPQYEFGLGVYRRFYYATYYNYIRNYNYFNGTNNWLGSTASHPSGWRYWDYSISSNGTAYGYYGSTLISGSPVETYGDVSNGNVSIWQNQYNAGAFIIYYDWFIRGKFVDPEPIHTLWGAVESKPELDQYIDVSDDTVNDEQWFFINVTLVSDNINGYLFSRIDIDPTNLNMSLSYTNSTDTFAEENNPSGYLELDGVTSEKTDINATFIMVAFYIRILPTVTLAGNYNVSAHSTGTDYMECDDDFINVFTLTMRTPTTPTKLFGAGFNGTSPYVSLRWTHDMQLITTFEVQNSSNGVSWANLGNVVTPYYTDNDVSDGLERYYQVRACRNTGSGWVNSSFIGNFEQVYFVSGGGGGINYLFLIPTAITIIFILSIVLLKRGK